MGVLVFGWSCAEGADTTDTPKSLDSQSFWTPDGLSPGGAGCHPFAVPGGCLLPYPSDFLRVADPTMPSGGRIAAAKSALPTTADGDVMDVLGRWPIDGFPVSQQIAVRLAANPRAADLVFHDGDIDATVAGTASTLLLSAADGTAIAHFAELDPRPTQAQNRALIIRPLQRLAPGTRYIVALRNLTADDGTPVPPPDGFAAVVSGVQHPGVSQHLREHLAAKVLAPLATRGWSADSLTVAWDFTTASREQVGASLQAVVDRARKIAPADVSIATKDVSLGAKDQGPIRVQGTFRAPNFQAQSGEIDVPYAAYVPASALGSVTPPRVLICGHGFFGDTTELLGGSYAQLLEHLGAIGVGVDWQGLAKADRGPVVKDLLYDLSAAPGFVDKLQGAMGNAVVLTSLVSARLPALLGPAYDAAKLPSLAKPWIGYYGASLGHILGATLVSIEPRIRRATLQVGGANFGLIMARSYPFGPMLGLIDGRFASELGSLQVLLLLQAPLARIEPLFWADRTIEPAVVGGGRRPLLMQVGVGDASVPGLAAQLHARTLGLGHDHPAPRTVWGLPKFDAAKHDSMYVEVDFGVADPTRKAIPPSQENEVHEGLRHIGAIRVQVDQFMRDAGKAGHTCAGPCDKGD